MLRRRCSPFRWKFVVAVLGSIPSLKQRWRAGLDGEDDQRVDTGRIHEGEPSPAARALLPVAPPPAAAARWRRSASRLRNRRDPARFGSDYFLLQFVRVCCNTASAGTGTRRKHRTAVRISIGRLSTRGLAGFHPTGDAQRVP